MQNGPALQARRICTHSVQAGYRACSAHQESRKPLTLWRNSGLSTDRGRVYYYYQLYIYLLLLNRWKHALQKKIGVQVPALRAHVLVDRIFKRFGRKDDAQAGGQADAWLDREACTYICCDVRLNDRRTWTRESTLRFIGCTRFASVGSGCVTRSVSQDDENISSETQVAETGLPEKLGHPGWIRPMRLAAGTAAALIHWRMLHIGDRGTALPRRSRSTMPPPSPAKNLFCQQNASTNELACGQTPAYPQDPMCRNTFTEDQPFFLQHSCSADTILVQHVPQTVNC